MESTASDGGARARGPYRPSAETRRRLIDAGLALFARGGFEATSTRQIAAAAGAALPSIAYHFGGKDQLRLACAQDVVERYRAAMGAPLAGITARRHDAAPDQARADLKAIMRLLVGMLGDGGEDWLDFMLREMTVASPSHDLLSRLLWQPGLELVSDLIARVRGRATGEAERAEALLLLSQLSTLGNFRRVTLEFLPGDAAAALIAAVEGAIDRL